MKKIRVGFVGFGKSVHRYHMPFISTLKYDLIGYYKRKNSKFEMPFKGSELLNRFDDLETLCSVVDLIVVATPAEFHFEYAQKCLNLGVNVLVEKPMCYSVEEAKVLFELANSKGLKLMSYQNRRFDSDFLSLKKALTMDIGDIYLIESSYSLNRPFDENSDVLNEGALFNLGIHFIDQVISLAGIANNVIGCTSSHRTGIADDNYNLIFEYDLMRVNLSFNSITNHPTNRWRVVAQNATVEGTFIDAQERDLKLGLMPGDNDFAKIEMSNWMTVFYQNGEEVQVKPDYSGYTQFYDDLYLYLNDVENRLVTQDQTLASLQIITDIIGKL